MADEERIGDAWNADELDLILADYFSMLRDELSGRPYVKAHHRARLLEQIARSPGAIERKHQNISAVLMELGLPWIWGYKPLMNFQDALFEAVDRYLSGRHEELEHPPVVVAHANPPEAVFVQLPSFAARPRKDKLERLVKKFDPVLRDFRNRRLGEAGERFVVELERNALAAADRLDLARKVRWVAMEDGDGAGFDVLSYDQDGGERLIEVKTTNGAAQTPFFLTRNEAEVASERSLHWQLYRVHLFAQQPRIFRIRPPLEEALSLDAETWRAVPRALPA
jgi:hypothetical protein